MKIKSELEAENAQIGREISLVDQRLSYLAQKKQVLKLQIEQLKSQIPKD